LVSVRWSILTATLRQLGRQRNRRPLLRAVVKAIVAQTVAMQPTGMSGAALRESEQTCARRPKAAFLVGPGSAHGGDLVTAVQRVRTTIAPQPN
jgi:hypothetical protein